MKLALVGYGKMGKLIEQTAIKQGHTIDAILTSSSPDWHLLSTVDMVIDFSHASMTLATVTACIKYKKNLVIGTTGWDHQLSEIKELIKGSTIGVFFTPNYCLGMQLFFELVQTAASLYLSCGEYDAGLLEIHHREKKDAPSGTALHIAHLLKKQIKPLSIQAMRLGSIPGVHTLTFDSPFDTITLSHTAKSKEGFAIGAIRVAQWLVGKQGFYSDFNQ